MSAANAMTSRCVQIVERTLYTRLVLVVVLGSALGKCASGFAAGSGSKHCRTTKREGAGGMTVVKQKELAKKCEHRSPVELFGLGGIYSGLVWCSVCGAIQRLRANGTRYWTLPGVSR